MEGEGLKKIKEGVRMQILYVFLIINKSNEKTKNNYVLVCLSVAAWSFKSVVFYLNYA